jgi:hypothetical protein
MENEMSVQFPDDVERVVHRATVIRMYQTVVTIDEYLQAINEAVLRDVEIPYAMGCVRQSFEHAWECGHVMWDGETVADMIAEHRAQ